MAIQCYETICLSWQRDFYVILVVATLLPIRILICNERIYLLHYIHFPSVHIVNRTYYCLDMQIILLIWSVNARLLNFFIFDCKFLHKLSLTKRIKLRSTPKIKLPLIIQRALIVLCLSIRIHYDILNLSCIQQVNWYIVINWRTFIFK